MSKRVVLVSSLLTMLVAIGLVLVRLASPLTQDGSAPRAPTYSPSVTAPPGGRGVVATTTATPSAAPPVATPSPKPPAMATADAGVAARLLAEGRQQQINGDDRAVVTFRQIVETYADAPAAIEARYRLGESLLDARQEVAALEALLAFVKEQPEHPLARRALFLAATAQRRLGRPAEAIALYQRYLEGNDLLAPYVWREIAVAHTEMAQPEEAIAAYEEALAGDPSPAYAQAARQSIAQLYLKLKEYDQSLAWWGRFDQQATAAWDKALALYSMAIVQKQTGQQDTAIGTLRRLIQWYPAAEIALQALEDLLHDGADVPALEQATVYFYNRRNDEAVSAYQRYLAHYPDGESAPRARYHLGILYRRLGKYAEAISEFDAVHRLYPNNDLAREAWLELARTMLADGQRGDAAEFYEIVAAWYPTSPQAEEALWEASVAYYGLGRFTVTRQLLARLLETFPASRYANRAAFWQAKALLAVGDAASARPLLERLAQDRRPDYYPMRARQVLAALQDATGRPVIMPDPVINERDAFISWLTGWAGPGPGLDVREDVHVQRGEELWHLHLWREAATEFAVARTAFKDDPWRLFNLIEYLHALPVPAQAIAAANRLLALSPTALAESPRYLWRMIYPATYLDLVTTWATEYSLDPLWLLALVRQESWFERYAVSTAEARGLTQVIPSTAQGIARSLGLTDFRQDDLFKPRLSLQFGAWYLAQQAKATNGNMLIALAGYNGGLMNALRWAGEQQAFDPDLFVENIAFSETQAYVRLVYQFYHVYAVLWGTAELAAGS